MNRAMEEAIKIWIALGGVILAFVWPWIPKEKVKRGILLALTVIALANYCRFDMSRFSGIDTYDVLVYYMSTRYFNEVGYFDLYPVMLLADQENGPFDRRLNRIRLQDTESGYRRRPLSAGMMRGREVRERFTRERWESFESDFLYLQRETQFPRANWRMLMDDRGFNGTPAWVVMATPFAKLFPPQWIKLLCLLDVLLLGLAFFAIRKAFGRDVMLWCLYFLLVCYSWRWTVPGNVFLRHDWIVTLMIATSMIKMGRPFIAGLFTGYSALMRFFPAVFMYGLASKMVSLIIKRRKIELGRYQQPLKVALGFIVMLVALEGAAAAILGVDTIAEHFEGMREHISPEELSSRRVGFAIGYGHKWQLRPRYIQPERKEEIANATHERLAIAFCVLLALAWGLRRSPDWEAYAFGFIPFFLLASASYYYYSMRVLLVIIHAFDLSKWRNRIGLTLLFAFEVFCNGSETLWAGHRMWLVGGLSQLLTLYCLLMVGWLIFEARQADLDEKKGSEKKRESQESGKKRVRTQHDELEKDEELSSDDDDTDEDHKEDTEDKPSTIDKKPDEDSKDTVKKSQSSGSSKKSKRKKKQTS